MCVGPESTTSGSVGMQPGGSAEGEHKIYIEWYRLDISMVNQTQYAPEKFIFYLVLFFFDYVNV